MKHLRLLTFAVLAMFTGLTAFAQEDITDVYLTNADLSSLEGWDYGDNGYNYTDYQTNGDVPVIEFYNAWTGNPNLYGTPIGNQKDFHFTQTVTLPAGNYRLAVNGFYREGAGNGTNTKAYIFAGEKTQYLVGLTSAGVGAYTGSNDLYRAANAFSRGDFSNEFDFDLEEQQTITIGFRGYIDTYISWCILGPVKLYKYSLNDYLVAYREKVAQAEALYNVPMNAQVLQDLQNAVLPESSFSLANQVTAQIAILNEKIAAANTSIADYAATNAAFDEYDAKAANLDIDAQAAYEAAVADIRNAYDNRTMTGNHAVEIQAAYQKAYNAGLTDITECAPTTWVGQNGSFSGLGETHIVAERYNASDYNPPYNYDGDVMTQTIENLPVGAYYKVTLEAAASYTSGRGFECNTGDDLAVVFANNTTKNLTVVDRGWISNPAECGPYEVIGKVGEDGILKYGIKKIDPLGGNWFLVNLISIVKVDYVPVESITAEDVDLELGSTAEIGAVVSPSNATLPDITYVSADETVAKVDKNGVITPVALGNTTITLTADEVSKTINVTVVEPAIVPESITLDPSIIALKFGETTTATITATISPAEAVQDVTFESSDTNVATVDAEGNVTATGIGTATITVTSIAKTEVTATITVTVSEADAPAVYSTTIENGTDYWLYNAAIGKFLGGANGWGTRASIIEHGIPFNAQMISDGIYNLDSYTSNGGNSHFLAIADNNPWIDQPASEIIFTPNSNGSFSLAIGDKYITAKTDNTEVDWVASNPANPFAQWYLISEADWMAMLQNASSSNPVDATFFIKDYNFSRNNTQYGEWTFEASNKNNAGDNTNLCVESYHAIFTMSQKLIVPNGTYKLTAQGFYRQDGTDNDNLPYFFANDEQGTFPLKTGSENSMGDASHSFSAGLYKIDPITVTVTDHILTIGAKNDANTSLWCIWDNFNLEMIDYSSDQGVEVKIGDLGYRTLYYGDFNLSIPTGLTASVVENVQGKQLVLNELGNVIPAGTGVILEGPSGIYSLQIVDEASPAGVNYLKGTDTETEINEKGYKYYILSAKNDVVGFYYQKNTNGASVTNGAHKAYLAVEESEQPADGVNVYLFQHADGIQNVNVENSSNNVYTISGVRVDGDKLTKGLYITNGKKIIIK